MIIGAITLIILITLLISQILRIRITTVDSKKINNVLEGEPWYYEN